MLRYNYVPNDFGRGLTIPIPKNSFKIKTAKTDDFRGITISPIISKVFEHCLYQCMKCHLFSSDLQFGFKKGLGCNHAIYTVQSTIDYYTSNNSTVNVCALDFAKTFDKINHYALFCKLMDRNVLQGIILLLECWYSKSITTVKWKGFFIL